MFVCWIPAFGLDKKSPSDYNGGRDAKAIVDAGLKEAGSVVRARLSGKAGSSSKSSGSKASGSKSSGSASGGDGAVIHATEASFKADVMDNDDFVMVPSHI